MQTLPLIRHEWHGDWNYTLRPAVPQTTADGDADDEPERPDRTWLHHPALTGLDPDDWDQLIQQLSVARHAQREAALHHRRGGARQAAAGTGRKARLTLPDRAAITLIYQRFSPPQRTLADLFGVTQQTINNIIRQTNPLLIAIGRPGHPTGSRLKTPTEIAQHIADAHTSSETTAGY